MYWLELQFPNWTKRTKATEDGLSRELEDRFEVFLGLPKTILDNISLSCFYDREISLYPFTQLLLGVVLLYAVESSPH